MQKILTFALVFTLCLTLGIVACADYDSETGESITHVETSADAEAAPEDFGIKILKDPGSEIDRTVGSNVIFLSFADGYTSFYWEILTGKGIFRADEITETYPDVEISGTDTARLSVKNIGLGQYGWKFRCVYKNDQGELPSAWAFLTVVEAGRSTAPAYQPCAPCAPCVHTPDTSPDPYTGTPLPPIPCECGKPVIIVGS